MAPILLHNRRPPSDGILGHLPSFMRDPLGFLTFCARSNCGVLSLRMLHKQVFLLLEPEDIERVLVTEHRDFIKAGWLRTPAVRRLLGDGLVTSEGDAWRLQRHSCQPAFQMRRMDRYGEQISEVVQRKLANWEPNDPINLQQEMSRLTMEIVGRVLFAVDDSSWTLEASRAMDILMSRFSSGWNLFGMIPWPPGYQERMATRALNRNVDNIIHTHEISQNAQFEDADDGDLLSMFKSSVDVSSGTSHQHVLREQVKTFLAAGYESSALTLTWVFLLLSQHPDINSKLTRELETVLSGRAPTASDIPLLPYTQAVIQETLRLYPPLWMTGRESAKKCVVGGVAIPAGSIVMTSQWAVHRMAKYFPCPNDFLPERWLTGETKNLPRCAYFPFGAGPRICIAQSFAMMETTLLLASIAQSFRVECDNSDAITPCATMTLRPPIGIKVILRAQEKINY